MDIKIVTISKTGDYIVLDDNQKLEINHYQTKEVCSWNSNDTIKMVLRYFVWVMI